MAVITDKIKSIIFKINVDEYNALKLKKMKIVLRIQRSCSSYF
jgi:hypothetical protein